MDKYISQGGKEIEQISLKSVFFYHEKQRQIKPVSWNNIVMLNRHFAFFFLINRNFFSKQGIATGEVNRLGMPFLFKFKIIALYKFTHQ